MPMSLPNYALDDADLLARCDEQAGRASGPGGQHANRTASAVRLVHRVSGIDALCSDMRERPANRRRALRHLRLRLACAQRGQADPAWVASRRQGQRLPVTVAASGYHLVVAALLDALDAHHGRLAPAAAALGISSSQLVRVLHADKQVRQAANALRADHGQGVLR